MENLITKLKAKIVEHRATYSNNETAVRRQLIEPILDELGWATDDPNLVELNAKTEDRDIPDYSLKVDKRVETYVEAKNLSINIIDHLPQLARYSINNGKEYGIITNGNEWLLIKTFEKDTKPRDRIIWQVSIENDEPSKIENCLSLISLKKIKNLPELIEKEKQIQNYWNEFISDKNRLLDKISSEITAEYLRTHPDRINDRERINNKFRSNLKSFLKDKLVLEDDVQSTIATRFSSKLVKDDKKFLKSGRNGSPSAQDWLNKIPELRQVKGLSTWKDICTHLDIPVEGDSARRRLDRWVRTFKPNWAAVPSA